MESLSSQFRGQLDDLMDAIGATRPHYVRCLKPNDQNIPDVLDRHRIVEQLRYGGVLEAVRVARSGFPVRYPHSQFVARYALLAPAAPHSCASAAAATATAGTPAARRPAPTVPELLVSLSNLCDSFGARVGKTKVVRVDRTRTHTHTTHTHSYTLTHTHIHRARVDGVRGCLTGPTQDLVVQTILPSFDHDAPPFQSHHNHGTDGPRSSCVSLLTRRSRAHELARMPLRWCAFSQPDARTRRGGASARCGVR